MSLFKRIRINPHSLPERKDPHSSVQRCLPASREPIPNWLPLGAFSLDRPFLLARMTYQPQTAGSAESDLIESMLKRQDEVLTGLDDLFDRIDTVIEELTEQRKREAAEESENILPFGPQPIESEITDSDSDSHSERAA